LIGLVQPDHRLIVIAEPHINQGNIRIGNEGIRQAEIVPGPKATTRQDIVDLVQTASASFGHAVGTARIGSDAQAVVHSDLRVRRLRGLRVADASVMLSIISGPTNAPAAIIFRCC